MITLYPHQRTGILAAAEAIKATGGYFLEWDPGTGKTLAGLLITRLLQAERTLVICPPVALGVWERHAKQFTPEIQGSIRHSQWNTAWGKPTANQHIIVTTYGMLESEIGHLQDYNPDFVVLDESHYVKSPSADRTKYVRRFFERKVKNKTIFTDRRRLLLSGTPAHNPLDWWSQYRIVDPTHPLWSQTFTSYKQWIAIPHPAIPQAVWKYRPECVTDAQRARAVYTHAVSASEMNVPEPIMCPMSLPFSGEAERKYYFQMEKQSFIDLGNGADADANTKLVLLLRLHQLSGGHVKATDGTWKQTGTSKLNALMQILNERKHQKVIIACVFREEIKDIENAIGYREGAIGKGVDIDGHVALTITGDTPPRERARIEQLFQTTQTPCALVLQYRAGGQALTLTEASALVLYSMSPSIIDYKQMIGRVWRVGQTKAVQVIPLMMRGTVDETVYAGLQAGRSLIEIVNDVTLRQRVG